jgi:hypothetical protein
MREMIIAAKEKAQAAAAKQKNLLGIATTLVGQTQKNHVKQAQPVAATAKTFVEILAKSYDANNYDEVKKHNATSIKISRDLIEARKGVDQAYVLARRLMILSWNHLRMAQRSLRNGCNQKKKLEEEKKRREEAEKNKPIKCPQYSYPAEMKSFSTSSLKATLFKSNSAFLGVYPVKLSGNAGQKPEDCAKMVLAAGQKCGNGEYMCFSPKDGCFCYPKTASRTKAAPGHSIFKISKIAKAQAKQTPRMLKEKAYCKNHKWLMNAKTVDECAAKVKGTSDCKAGDSIFTWDPANKGWCSCCKNSKDALRYTVVTRAKECKIYKAKNDRTND